MNDYKAIGRIERAAKREIIGLTIEASVLIAIFSAAIGTGIGMWVTR